MERRRLYNMHNVQRTKCSSTYTNAYARMQKKLNIVALHNNRSNL